jgi:uncharacterized membrane protein
MHKGRVEAFSDGVIAIILTIMVLELKAPDGAGWLNEVEVRKLLGYVLSFVFIGIYWSNHHHMLAVVKHVNGGVLWANLHLLFWLSLVPFVTEWMGNKDAGWQATMSYAIVLLCSGIAYTILQTCLVRLEGPQSQLARAVGRDRKGLLSLALYIAAMVAAPFEPLLSDAIFVTVALIWIVPDRRIERHVGHESHAE